MSRSVDELWALLAEVERMPYGAARIALVEQVIRHSDGLGDADLSFSARMLGTTAYVYGGEPAKSFVTFSWCVSDFDRHPGPHHQRWEHNLLWQFKAEVMALTKFPEVPLARTYAVLDDMERRYREGGFSLQAVHKHRFHLARHLGDEKEADRLYGLWTTTPRDSLSDCAGCDPTSKVTYLADRHGDEEAIALAEPVLAGRLTCTQQPQNILLALMVPYLRTGRLEQAVDAHRRAYRLIRGSLADLWDIGEHIEFCARTGNEHRGLEILRRHVDWLDKAPSPAAGMVFAASGALLLRRLTAIGHGDAEVRRGSTSTTVAALGEELAAYATGQAERFDARNGTSARSERVASLLGAEQFPEVLPLSPTARRATPGPAPARPAGPEVPEVDAGTLIRLAEEHEREDRHAGVVVVLAAFDRRFPDVEALDPETAARRMLLLGTELWRTTENPELAIAPWERGAELFDAAGQAIEASEARGRLGLVRCVLGDAETGLPLVEADLAVQEERGDAVSRTRARARWATALVTQGRYEEGVAAQDRALAAASESGDARMVARNLTRKAHYLLGQHRHQDAEVAVAEAVAFYREHGPAESLALADLLYARIAQDRETVVAACTEVLDLGDPAHAAEARSTRGYALQRLNRPADAIPDFVEWVALCTEQGDDIAGAFARLELARSYLGAGRDTEAAEVAEEAIIWLDRGGQKEAADDARLVSARAYLGLGANEDAVACYAELVERLADNPAGRGQIQEYAADLLFRMDRDAEAAERFGLAAADLRTAGDPVGEVRALRRRVLALRWADEPEAALETAELAQARHAELGRLAAESTAIWERAMLGYETGMVLLSASRPAEAEVLLRGLLDGLAADDELREPVVQALADALDELGRTAEATSLRDD